MMQSEKPCGLEPYKHQISKGSSKELPFLCTVDKLIRTESALCGFPVTCADCFAALAMTGREARNDGKRGSQ
jgi:hypothetical protein